MVELLSGGGELGWKMEEERGTVGVVRERKEVKRWRREKKGRNFCFLTSAIVAALLSFVASATSSTAFFFLARVVGALDCMGIASGLRGK